jgi:hypothetical protein
MSHKLVRVVTAGLYNNRQNGAITCVGGGLFGNDHRGRQTMSDDKRDVLEVLKFELNFLEQGGYGRSVRTPWKPTSVFLDSPSCINFNDSGRPHPCNECLLTDFVPPKHREEETPCHHIPLNPQGETVYTMERQREQIDLEEALKNWLRETIQRIERERAAKPQKVSITASPAP